MKRIIRKCECGSTIEESGRVICRLLFCKLFTKYGYYEDGKPNLNEKGQKLLKIGTKGAKSKNTRRRFLIETLISLGANKISTEKAIDLIKGL